MDLKSKEEIVEVELRLLTAMQNSDTDELETLLHDDLLFVIPSGQTVTKEMDLANLISGNLVIDSISTSEQQISLIDDNAMVSVLVELKGAYLGQSIDGHFKYLRVWKLTDNNWKVIGGAGIQI